MDQQDCYTDNVFLLGANVLPPPSNLEYSFIQICTLNWTWNPPENISSGCDLEYSSDIVIDESRFRVVDMFLNEEVRFKVRSECKNTNTSEPSRWVEASLLPEGIPGTAAADLSCVWHNLEYMACTWRPGRNASDETNYMLFYWFDGLKKHKKCSNSSVHQGVFGCVFNLSFPKVTNTYPAIKILIRDESEEIRPLSVKYTFKLILPCCISVKPATPRRVTVSKRNDEIHVEWSGSDPFPENCLFYEVEYHNGDLDTAQKIKVIFHSLYRKTVTSLSFYSFCFPGEKTDSTFYFALIVTIPLIVAVSTIILLVYLKRLKILILPPVPDPREILKRMFGEQNEDSRDDPVNAYDKLIKEEEIHSLILTEPPECTNSETEN
uniref:Interleukin 13 receptor subunit alpha 1 n=1 Tax=Strigops habroptila TaxID=2489341 RepID=A0A672VCL0_STRHB